MDFDFGRVPLPECGANRNESSWDTLALIKVIKKLSKNHSLHIPTGEDIKVFNPTQLLGRGSKSMLPMSMIPKGTTYIDLETEGL